VKYISIDCEMSGLDSLTCDVIEFGAVLDDLNIRAPIETLPMFHCYLVKDSYCGEPYALSMHPTIFRRIAERGLEENRRKYNYLTATSLGNAFKKFLLNNGYTSEHDKVVVTAAGKNFSSFDLQFLKHRTDFLKHIEVRSGVLDPGILYLENEDKAVPGLEKCKKRAGMTDTTVYHDAISDAKDVVELLRKKL
jgi:hypothetical protein